jgi:hypothetical protein
VHACVCVRVRAVGVLEYVLECVRRGGLEWRAFQWLWCLVGRCVCLCLFKA